MYGRTVMPPKAMPARWDHTAKIKGGGGPWEVGQHGKRVQVWSVERQACEKIYTNTKGVGERLHVLNLHAVLL